MPIFRVRLASFHGQSSPSRSCLCLTKRIFIFGVDLNRILTACAVLVGSDSIADVVTIDNDLLIDAREDHGLAASLGVLKAATFKHVETF